MIYLKMMRLPHQLFCLIPLLLGILDSGHKLLNGPVPFFFLGFLLSSTAQFLLNDYVDSFDTDQHSTDPRATKGNKLNKNVVLVLLVLLALLALLFFFLSGVTGLILGFIIFVLMQIYSFPGIRLKNIKYLDVLDQIVAWGVLPYLGGYLITGTPINWFPLVFIVLFFTGAAGLAPILDISGDKKGGLVNTTVAWGYKKSLNFGFWTLYCSLIIGLLFIFSKSYPWYWLMIPPGMLALGVYGYARGNYDRPERLEMILLLGKKWGKIAGWGTFAILLISAL